MDHNAPTQPDKAAADVDYQQMVQDQEAMKAIMAKVLEANPSYLQNISHLYRRPDPDAKPKHLFFYGSLMDPDVVRVITETAAEPELHKASITGFKLKMWGFYPTLVPGEAGDIVHGVYWQAENDRQLGLIQRYETHRYKTAACAIRIEKDGTTVDEGLAFVWAGDPASSELKDGEFLLERYQMYFKPDAFKRTT